MEILSPVKNFDNAKVAISAGADAIYFSSNIFGARQSAKNDREEVVKIVEYAKLHCIKTYVTLNTVILNEELPLFLKEVNFLHSIGVDAVILQDFAMIEVVKSMFEDLEVHCSTQMNIGNSYAANFVKDKKASRVVIPRELRIEEIRAIGETGLETEVFVHGALCTSYSGLCLISSVESNLSGNRGKCSQFCRMKTIMYKNGEECESGDFMLALKDLNASNSVEDLLDLNVSSVKIEGRLKQQEYVALTTYTYRNLKEKINIENELHKVYNREFTNGYLNDVSSTHISNNNRINNNGYYAGEVVDHIDNWVYIKTVTPLEHLDKIRFILDDFETGQTIDVIESCGDDTYKVKTRFNNMIGSKVYVVSSANVINRVKSRMFDCYSRRSYPLVVNMKIGKCIEVIYQEKSFYSTAVLESAKTQGLTFEDISKQLSKTGDYSFDFDLTINYVEGFIRKSELNQLRREVCDFINLSLLKVEHQDKNYEYHIVSETSKEKVLYIEVNTVSQVEQLIDIDYDIIIVTTNKEVLESAKKLGFKVYILFPSVVEESHCQKYLDAEHYDGAVVSEVGGLQALSEYNKPIISSYTLNTTNIINQQMLQEYCDKTVLSVECSYDDLKMFNEARAVGFLYGHINVMTMKYCPINQTKKSSCGSCRMCEVDNYEIQIKDNTYSLMKEDYDKIALLSSKPIYNSKMLECNFDYYIRLTNEENVKELIFDIFNNNINDYIDSYENVLE